MIKFKIQNPKFENSDKKAKVSTFNFLLALFTFNLLFLTFCLNCPAQPQNELEFSLDVNANTILTPGVFKPNIDLSGRGYSHDPSWPQSLSGAEALDTWQKDIGFSGIYRLQYDLWEIYQLSKDKVKQDKLLANYEEIIRKISDSGGIVMLNIYGTPAGLGRILDKKSPFYDFSAFKELVKNIIRNLSCDKRYNIWYEVWSAPDLDDFFLGRKQEYLLMYRAIAESAKELEAETRIHIPVGGPSVSWWFQNVDGNNIIHPEHSLIYELIKFCYGYRLPLDFITWHAFSSDPKAEKEVTRYNKTAVALIRDWLSYFRFNRNIPLIIDEWNFDSGANVSPARGEKASIGASYIMARLKNMYDSGLDYQLYFSLEDFNNEKESVVRNTGIFSIDADPQNPKARPKSTFNIFKMLQSLGKNMYFSLKLDDDFVGAIATKGKDYYVVALYNYIDPSIAVNYVSRNIARLSESERRFVINLIKKGRFDQIIRSEPEMLALRSTKRVKSMLKKAQELYFQAERYKASARAVKMNIKNLKKSYTLQKFILDDACNFDCAFSPAETHEVNITGSYSETLSLKPYSVVLMVFKIKPAETQIQQDKTTQETPAESNKPEAATVQQSGG